MTDSPKRRWFSFRLRTLLVVVLVLGCVLTPLAIRLQRSRAQGRIVGWVLERGGWVEYDYQSDDKSVNSRRPKWLRDLLGDEFFKSVRLIDLSYTKVEDLSPLQELRDLPVLDLWNTNVSDLSPLRRLAKLERLYLRYTNVTDEEVKRLKKALPDCKIYR